MPLFATSTINDGNMSMRFDTPDTALANRKQFLVQYNIVWEDHVCMRCDHGEIITEVTTATDVDQFRMVQSEVLITKEKNLALMLLTGDCLPVLYYDPASETIALAHQSRHTIANALPEKLMTHLPGPAATLQVYTGPHIHSASYRFALPQAPLPPLVQPYTRVEDGYVHIDVTAAHDAQLIAAGVPPEHIHHSAIDTGRGNTHFSYYQSAHKNAPEGRIATIAMLS